MIVSATTQSPSPEAPSSKPPSLTAVVILALIVIVAVGTGIAYAQSTSGPAQYACISISHNGGSQRITTSGLLHYTGSTYYISCSEGSSLPTGTYSASCLTISPKTIPAAIGLGASTEYYYISSNGHAISIQGAASPVNATEFITPAGITLTVSC